MSVYLDASVLVSLFIDDVFADRADKALRARVPALVVSDFAAAEFASAVAQYVRMGALTLGEAGEVLSDFDVWTERAATRVETLSADIRAAEGSLRRLDLTVRAPDAIHIATAQRIGAELATFDMKMAESARLLGTQILAI